MRSRLMTTVVSPLMSRNLLYPRLLMPLFCQSAAFVEPLKSAHSFVAVVRVFPCPVIGVAHKQPAPTAFVYLVHLAVDLWHGSISFFTESLSPLMRAPIIYL